MNFDNLPKANKKALIKKFRKAIIESEDIILRTRGIQILKDTALRRKRFGRTPLSKTFKRKISLEVTNEDPITGDVSLPDTDELKQRIFDNFAAQSRAVTAQDYKAVVYAMPPKFGSVKRVNILQDRNTLKRNLNLYVYNN